LNAALKELFRGKHDVAPYKGIQDSLVFWISGTGFQFLSVGLGFWIPIVSGIPDFLELYSGFQSPRFDGISQILESRFPYMWQMGDVTAPEFTEDDQEQAGGRGH